MDQKDYIDETLHTNLRIPERLFGRERELAALEQAWAYCRSGRSAAVMIHGQAGVGKTALAHEFRRTVSQEGIFVSGKFDSFVREEPYGPLVGAFRQLAKRLLAEDEESLSIWKRKLRKDLGQGGFLLAELIPELRFLVGQASRGEGRIDSEAERIYQATFLHFIRAICRKHPVVLFLDDLHWADAATWELLNTITADSKTKGLLILGTCWDEEPGNGMNTGLGKPLCDMKLTPDTNVIGLTPLSIASLNRFLAETLSCPEKRAAGLTDILYRKTGGNPFHVKQLLQSVYKKGLLRYVPKSQAWEWDAVGLEALKDHESIVRLLTDKMNSLPEHARELLTVASVLGNVVEVSFLSAISGNGVEAVRMALQQMVAEGLLIWLDGEGVALIADDENCDAGNRLAAFRFIHDHVRQTAYALLDSRRRSEIHGKAGALLLSDLGEQERNERIFEIIGHLNRRQGKPVDERDTDTLVGLNLQAGLKAKQAFDFETALRCLRAADNWLESGPSKSDYGFRFDLRLERLALEYLRGDTATAESLARKLAGEARNKYGLARIYKAQMDQHVYFNRRGEAIRLGLKLLSDFAIRIPSRPGPLSVLKEIHLAHWAVRRSLPLLDRLPELREPEVCIVLDVLLAIASAAGYADGKLLAVLLSRAVRLSLKYGRGSSTLEAFAAFAGMVGWATGDFKTACRLATLSVEMAEAEGDLFVRTNVYGAVYPLLVRITPVRGTEQFMKKAAKDVEATGLPHANGIFASIKASSYYMAGKLRVLSRYLRLWTDHAMETDDPFLVAVYRMYRDFVSHFREKANGSKRLFGNGEEEKEWIEALGRDEAGALLLGQYWAMRVQLSCLLGSASEATALAVTKERTITAVPFLPHHTEFWFYGGVAAASCDGAGFRQRRFFRKAVLQMKKWTAVAPENFAHRYDLLLAEQARLKGAYQKAAELYERAVRGGRDRRFSLSAALAGERAAAFYQKNGLEKTAAMYALGAYRDYLRAGTSVKADRIADLYSALWGQEEIASVVGSSKSESQGATQAAAGVANSTEKPLTARTDFADIVCKMVEWTTVESSTDTLWLKLLESVAANANAHKVAIIVHSEKTLSVYALLSAEGCSKTRQPLEGSNDICARLVLLAARTLETVMLDDAVSDGVFGGDPYISRYQVRSVCVLPVAEFGKTIGYLYMENAGCPGAFNENEGRLELWNLLASQAIRVLMEGLPPESGSLNEPDPLTEREREVLALLAEGLSNKELADRLSLSEGTVKVHLNRIYDKLSVKRRTQAVEQARKRGLL